MAGPALALGYLLFFFLFSFSLFLLVYCIKRRRTLKKSLPAGFLFLVLTVVAIYIYYNSRSNEYNASRKFLGDYKLERLDGRKCDSCLVRLYEGYTYSILVQDKIVGQGEWQIESAIDIPGYFLRIDNGPTSVIWEQDRLIEYIDRTTNK
jgi:4-amino-4-deoxy-L-arabinose transferase-like glycosyltransferase